MLKLILKYINHFLTASKKNSNRIKTNEVRHFVNQVLTDRHPFYCFTQIEKQRKKLLKNKHSIHITDFGAGSKVFKGNTRKISSIAKYSLKPANQAQLLFRLINFFQPKTILELGTSLGITTCYLAKPNSNSKVISFEGCPEQIKIAQNNFKTLDIKNIETIPGNINETLNNTLLTVESLDFVFFDGNHTYKATSDYFEKCLPKVSSSGIFVFDDIHLNPEMEQFWKELKLKSEVKVTIDIFHFGLAFFNPNYTQEDIKLRL